MNRYFRSGVVYIVLVLLIVAVWNYVATMGQETEQMPYNDYKEQLANGKLADITIRPDGGTYLIEGKFAGQDRTFQTRGPLYDGTVIPDLEKSGVNVSFEKEEGPSIWFTFFTSIIPFVLIFILFFFLLNQAQGGGGKVMNFGKSKAKLYSEEKKKVTFDDVAGADEEKAELIEVVDFLKDHRRFTAIGARIPKGVLLVGPPGTGKTLLARAVAGEAGVPFFSISGSDFVEMFVGVGASRVRDLFENAKKNSPCIIFIDEIDAVGRQRGAGLGGGHDEREQTLNQLLVEMDGFGANEGIIMIAATNRPDILDPALLRPGRFDRQITVDRPDVRGREAVLKVHARNKPFDDSVDLKVIARRTPGFTGADLENLMNEAALLTARRNKKEISSDEIDEAIDRVIAGPEKKSRLISDMEKKIVAYHEAGHTVVGYHLEHADEVHKVTVVPRGSAGGYTVMLPKEDRYFMTKTELLGKVVGLLGGRVAEELVLGEISTGAHNDFERATGIIRRMITEFGMSDRLGPLQFGRSQGEVFLGRDIGHEQNYSDAIAYEIDKEMQDLMRECYERCTELLTKHRDDLELIAQTLLEKETLDASQIKQLIENGKLDEPEEEEDVKVQIQGKKDEKPLKKEREQPTAPQSESDDTEPNREKERDEQELEQRTSDEDEKKE